MNPVHSAYKVCEQRNSGEAYRQFRSASLFAGAHTLVRTFLRHQLFGLAIAAMGAAGFVGTLITFWPR